MASSTPKTILLEVNGGSYDERPVHDDALVLAANTITPGDLITWDTAELKPNATAADADAQVMVAVENPYLDPRTATSPAIDTDYAAAAACRYIYPQSGDLLYMWIKAGHAAVVRGAPLESASGGDLQAYSNGRIIGFADEAVDNSGGGSHARIRVRIA